MVELTEKSKNWRRPEVLLLLMSIAMPLAFSAWLALLNNFVVERAGFSGLEIGILQSLREVPGFIAFTTVFILLLLKEQSFAVLALATLGLGVALTGFLPTELGLYTTTVIMSLGFHYFATVKQSLALQWLEKGDAPRVLGKLIAVGSATSLVVYGAIWLLLEIFKVDYVWIYLIAGSLCLVVALALGWSFPTFPARVPQVQKLVLRRRYWLYYALTFVAGARRQIFMVFAGFMMVQKFRYSAADIALLFIINYVFNWFFAERVGALIGRFGERRALTLEYAGLILVFSGYAMVENATVAAGLYVIDHMFFALAIAISTYFQKIADPGDLAATAGVSFTISHIAAVVIPSVFGIIWLYSPAAVFFSGTAFAVFSLGLAQMVPRSPQQGNEVTLRRTVEI